VSSNSLVAERSGNTCIIRLKDGPKATASKHANYDAWLALRVLGQRLTDALGECAKSQIGLVPGSKPCHFR